MAKLNLTCTWDGTLFTGLIPGPTNVIGTAAHLLGHIEQQLSITGLVVSVIVSIAQTSPHVWGRRKTGIGDAVVLKELTFLYIVL